MTAQVEVLEDFLPPGLPIEDYQQAWKNYEIVEWRKLIPIPTHEISVKY